MIRPVRGRIVDHVSLSGHLHQDAHFDRAAGNSVFHFVEEKIRVLFRGRGCFEKIIAARRDDAVAPEFADALAVREFVSAHRVKRFSRETAGYRFGA